LKYLSIAKEGDIIAFRPLKHLNMIQHYEDCNDRFEQQVKHLFSDHICRFHTEFLFVLHCSINSLMNNYTRNNE